MTAKSSVLPFSSALLATVSRLPGGDAVRGSRMSKTAPAPAAAPAAAAAPTRLSSTLRLRPERGVPVPLRPSPAAPARGRGRGRGRSDKATMNRRIGQTLQLILEGAEFADIRQIAIADGWNVTDRQIRRYVEVAYSQLAEASRLDREQLLGRHLMQRRALYARALHDNNIHAALAVLRDEAILQGLYPGHGGH